MRAPTSSAIREITLLGLYLSIGILFRLWLASLAPQPFINDQRDYDYFAGKILADPHMIASHSFRTYPYPMLLALLYRFVGFGNHQAVIVFQAILDSLTGVLIYALVLLIRQKKSTARLALFIYALNPFTAGYVNVVLSEVMATFFMVASVLSGAIFVKTPSKRWGLLFGFTMGLSAQTRNAVFLWTLIPLGLALYYVPLRKNVGGYGWIALGVFLTMIYPLISNWRDFREIRATTVDSFYAKEFFNGVVIRRLAPLAPPLPMETYEMYAQYYSEYNPERDSNYRKMISRKYYDMAWERIWQDPLDYLTVRLDKMWYVWQKEAIYVYREPGFEKHKPWIYALNLILLAMGGVGLFLWKRSLTPQSHISRWVWGTVMGTIVYSTFVFSLTHAEHRLTIPFYPLLIVCGAIGLNNLRSYIFRSHSSISP